MFGDAWERARDIFYETFRSDHLANVTPMPGAAKALLAGAGEIAPEARIAMNAACEAFTCAPALTEHEQAQARGGRTHFRRGDRARRQHQRQPGSG